jgi:hypothetical protein
MRGYSRQTSAMELIPLSSWVRAVAPYRQFGNSFLDTRYDWLRSLAYRPTLLTKVLVSSQRRTDGHRRDNVQGNSLSREGHPR